MSGLVRNRWEITKAGITRLDELTRLAANSQMEIATKRALDAARLYCSSKTTTP
ncbi:MAG: hypothetical protein KF912_00755 [Phycisphaeraceae bacterium]|nr:hypothetical protein [Phycisphaeraceae bacterium]MBX3365828.1 hypothetical protein [Phycisphaeraceae bacterium]